MSNSIANKTKELLESQVSLEPDFLSALNELHKNKKNSPTKPRF